MPQTTVKQRFLAISHYNKGKSVNFISKSMKIPRTTIYNIIQRYKKDPTTLENRPKTGRPQILDKFEQKLIIRKCLAQPNLNSTQLLASLELSQKVSTSYVRKLLLRNGLHAKVCTTFWPLICFLICIWVKFCSKTMLQLINQRKLLHGFSKTVLTFSKIGPQTRQISILSRICGLF